MFAGGAPDWAGQPAGTVPRSHPGPACAIETWNPFIGCAGAAGAPGLRVEPPGAPGKPVPRLKARDTYRQEISRLLILIVGQSHAERYSEVKPAGYETPQETQD